ncbi:MAG: aldolase/citrate lyase family protein [Vicinamibacterales bacterium]
MSTFRHRLHARELLVGTFLKTPTTHATEILGDLGFDFVVIDEEHAPFDRAQTDVLLLAARASHIAGVVRVPSADPAGLLSVLDCGADAVLVPHVVSADMARRVVSACRYRGGSRGFSASARAGRYGGLGMWEHVDRADASVAVIAMIEDPAAVEHIDEIVAVEGLDAVFIGRGDLSVSYGAPGKDAPVILDAVARIMAAAARAGKPVCLMTDSLPEAKTFAEAGASAFIVASDQAFMRKAARAALAEFATLKK